MPNVGAAVTGTVTSGTTAGGPMLGGGAAGVASLIPPCEIPHGYFSKTGKSILVDGLGVYSLGSSIPTIKIGLYLDSVVGTNTGTALATTGAFTADTTSRAAMAFNFRVYVTCTATGVSGTLQSWGWLNWGMVPSLTTTVAAPQITYYMGAGTTAPFAFNTSQSVPTYLEPMANWSTTSTGPSITLTQMFVWGLN
jgi:hypothetical protein